MYQERKNKTRKLCSSYYRGIAWKDARLTSDSTKFEQKNETIGTRAALFKLFLAEIFRRDNKVLLFNKNLSIKY